jgi:hypothetical protein
MPSAFRKVTGFSAPVKLFKKKDDGRTASGRAAAAAGQTPEKTPSQALAAEKKAEEEVKEPPKPPVPIDKEVEGHRAYLNSVLEPLSALIAEYKSHIDGQSRGSVLKTTHLAVWARSPVWCGSAPAGRALHVEAARVHVVGNAVAEHLAKPSRSSLKNLTAAEKELRNALATIEAYESAESDLPDAVAKATRAAEQVEEAKAEVEAASTGPVLPMRQQQLDRLVVSRPMPLGKRGTSGLTYRC